MALVDMTEIAARLPLLITGVTGVAGYNAFFYFQERYPGQVVGTRPHQTATLRGPGIVALDAEDATGMRALFEQHRFRTVLNCVGNCALKSCELNPAMARLLNVHSAAAVADCARAFACRLVHLSSDPGLLGGGGRQLRRDRPGRSGNGLRQDDGGGGAVDHGGVSGGGAAAKISLPMGPSFNHHAGAIDWIQSRFRGGQAGDALFRRGPLLHLLR